MKKTQEGFAIIESLLIILILVIIGFGGYYVWHTQQQTNKTLDQAANTSQKTASSTADSSAAQKYLTIKEWGIKFTTSKESRDAYYVFDDGTHQYINLDSKDIDALKTYNGKSCKGEYVAKLARYAKSDPALTSDGIDAAIGERKTVGNYVYTFATLKQYGSACFYNYDKTDASGSPLPLESNTAIYDQKKTAYSAMYETISAE
jgi:hypothetical protein